MWQYCWDLKIKSIINMATRGYASQIGEKQLNTNFWMLTLKNLSKDIKFHYFFLLFQIAFSCRQKRPPQATLYQPKLWHSALCIRLIRYTTLSLSPSGASHSILLSGCQVNNLSWHLPFSPLPSSFPSNKKSVSKLAGRRSEIFERCNFHSHTQVLPTHILPNTN